MIVYYVYILYSPSVKQYYIGETQDLPTRLLQHNDGLYSGSFTKRADDWIVFHSIKCESRVLVRKIEAHVKNMKSRKYLENLKRFPEIELKLISRYS